MPYVFNENNKIRNEKIGKSEGAKKHRILDKEDVLNIRKMKNNCVPLKEIVKIYQFKASKSCIADVYYERTYKEIK